MQIKFYQFLLFCLILCACKKSNNYSECGIIENTDPNPQTLSILFIGTSHTFYNDLPVMVSSIARSVGDSAYTEMSAPGGYDFERHFKLAETISALNSRNWDYIVLQESGWRVALPPSLAEVRIYPFADSMKKLITTNNPNAKLILYMTNGYVDGVNSFGDVAWCTSDPQVCTFPGMLERIKGSYLHLGEQLNAEIAPCGLIWKEIKSRDISVILHDADGIHPNLLASYANAITIYSTIRKKRMNAVFAPAAIPSSHATLVQNTISEILFDCNPSWKNL